MFSVNVNYSVVCLLTGDWQIQTEILKQIKQFVQNEICFASVFHMPNWLTCFRITRFQAKEIL